MLSLGLFFLLISVGGVFSAVYLQKTYEEFLPLTMFSFVEIVFLIGLVDNLRLGCYMVFLLAGLLWFFSLRRLYHQPFSVFQRIVTPAMLIFLILTIIYAFSIVGRVAWQGDEFSFWSTSVKKMWYLNAFHCIPAAEPYFAEYPPGMQIVEFFPQILYGAFSEWRISYAYVAYIFLLFLPFLRGLRHKNILKNLLLAGLIFSCGTIIYPDALDNLQVDFALGATFGYAMALLISPLSQDGEYDWLTITNVIAAANMMVLIKSAGKLFAAITVLTLLGGLFPRLKEALKQKNNKRRNEVLLSIVLCAVPFLTGLLWKWKYSSYGTHIAFDSGSYNLKEFILVLLGKVDGGYRSTIVDSFFTFLVKEPIQIGPFVFSNVFLLITFSAVFIAFCLVYRKYDLPFSCQGVEILLVGNLIYWIGLLASYMYTFSEGEGLALASMQRYLNIYHSAIVLLFVYLLLKLCSSIYFEPKFYIVVLLLISLSSFGNLMTLLSHRSVKNSIAQRASLQTLVDQIAIQPKNDEKETVLLIHRGIYPHIPCNHFQYILWPNYIVPWECSYGSVPLAEGDYSQILTSEEFRQHVVELSSDYIAIDLIDDDFVATYGELFNAPLTNGQVYRVTENTVPYELIQP